MATPNFSQVQAFSNVGKQLQQAAIDEFSESIGSFSTLDEVIEEAARIAEKYRFYGAELGAQWYDLCTQLAGIDAEAALISDEDSAAIQQRAQRVGKQVQAGDYSAFNYFLQDEVNRSIRETGNANLWRDYERGLAPGKWARVPVGPTCAFCLMLASNGAWYVSKESALGLNGNHYHNNCDCIAVYHAEPDDIDGFNALKEYKEMYYHADNLRQANKSGRNEYPEELQERVNAAKAEHQRKLDAGETEEPWRTFNENLIVMRYEYGLK